MHALSLWPLAREWVSMTAASNAREFSHHYQSQFLSFRSFILCRQRYSARCEKGFIMKNWKLLQTFIITLSKLIVFFWSSSLRMKVCSCSLASLWRLQPWDGTIPPRLELPVVVLLVSLTLSSSCPGSQYGTE